MGLLGTSFRLFSMDGINVYVHITYIIWAIWRLTSARGGLTEELIELGMLFLIVLAHEFGHCYGSRAVGGNPRQILMWPLGGLAFAEAPMRVWPQFVTVACGPLVNVGFCLISAGLLAISGHADIHLLYNFIPLVDYRGPSPMLAYLETFYFINLLLFVFNMLPFFPMDGGQLLRCGLWALFGYGRATIYSCYIGIAGAAFFAAWGLGILGGPGQPILVMIAIFGGLNCIQTLAQTRHDSITADEFMSVDRVLRDKRRRPSFWSRLFGARTARGRSVSNPNPGGWQARMDERADLSSEVDRILRKVHDHGIHSLTYVERQTLEQATRRERERGTHV